MLKLEPQPPPRQIALNAPPEQLGRTVYKERCQMCHGEERRGVPPEIPSLVDVMKRMDADSVKRLIVRDADACRASPRWAIAS